MMRHPQTWTVAAISLLLLPACIEMPAAPGDDNEPPTVSILSPADGGTVTAGEAVKFEAEVADPDGFQPKAIWESDIDGQIYDSEVDGAPGRASWSFRYTGLSVGSHTITVRGIDSDGGVTSESIGLTVVAVPSEWRQLDGGMWHTCGITTDTDLYCWGYNLDGQVGDGTMTDRLSPSLVAGGRSWSSVTTGSWYTCGLSGTELYCWGDAEDGQLGDGRDSDGLTPTRVSGSWTDVSAGTSTTCAIDTASRLYCWGDASDGQIGNGSTGDEDCSSFTTGADCVTTPVAVTGSRSWASVSVGSRHACALTTAGDAWCWGKAQVGQLGDGDTGTQDCLDDDAWVDCTTTPVQVSGGHQWTALSVGGEHTCAITTAGALYCWGYGDAGQLGTGSRTDRLVPTLVSGGHTWKTVAGGRSHTCGITTSSAMYCWGYGNAGQRGDGRDDIPYQTTPVLVQGGHGWSSVAGGGAHTCATTPAADGYCWGDGFHKQLGNGLSGSAVPTLISDS